MLNVSSATQGLILITTNIISVLSSHNLPCVRDGTLHSAISKFRATLQNLLPTSILASLSQERAALLPATDLVAVLSEAVLLFSAIEESVSDVSQTTKADPNEPEAVDVAYQIAKHCVRWSSELEEVNGVLEDYMTILKWFADRHFLVVRYRKR